MAYTASHMGKFQDYYFQLRSSPEPAAPPGFPARPRIVLKTLKRHHTKTARALRVRTYALTRMHRTSHSYAE